MLYLFALILSKELKLCYTFKDIPPLPSPMFSERLGLVRELAGILIGFTFDAWPNAKPDGAEIL